MRAPLLLVVLLCMPLGCADLMVPKAQRAKSYARSPGSFQVQPDERLGKMTSQGLKHALRDALYYLDGSHRDVYAGKIRNLLAERSSYWPYRIKSSVRSGELVAGMGYGQVTSAWGSPHDKSESTLASGTTLVELGFELDEGRSHRVARFRNGELTSWSEFK